MIEASNEDLVAPHDKLECSIKQTQDDHVGQGQSAGCVIPAS